VFYLRHSSNWNPHRLHSEPFPPKENHNVGLLRFDDDHDHLCYRFAQVQIFGGKSNVFKSLQLPTQKKSLIPIIRTSALSRHEKYCVSYVHKLFCEHSYLQYSSVDSYCKPYSCSQTCSFWPSDTNNYFEFQLPMCSLNPEFLNF
jgi:hypothetical protein